MKKPSDDHKGAGAQRSSYDVASAASRESLRKPRRRLIQALAASGVITSAAILPKKWAKPAVESVTIPAHAQTTGESRNEARTVELCNTENFMVVQIDDRERPESLLASGVERVWGEVVHEFVEAAYAGDDPEPEACEPTGCARIRYSKASDSGTLYLGYIDGLGVMEAQVPFVDGETGSLNSTCFEPGGSFRVDLDTDEHATLTLMNLNSSKSTTVLDMVRNCSCEPFEDFSEDT